MRVEGLTTEFQVRAVGVGDRPLVERILTERWGTTVMARQGTTFDAAALPGLLALAGERPAGLLTYAPAGESWELATIDSLTEGRGVGTALVAALAERARAAGARRIWLITTNDNLRALRFYQRHGFELAALHRGAVNEARRRLKPSIPAIGDDGIPIRDELELELSLAPS